MGNALPPGTQISPDGRWYWDGQRWAPVSAAPQPASSAFPPAMYAYAPRTNSLAVASLVTGILSWLLCPFLGAVLAVVFGHMARGQIKNTGEGGGGMAMAGLVLGYANAAGSVILFLFWIVGIAIFGAFLNGVSLPSPSPIPSA